MDDFIAAVRNSHVAWKMRDLHDIYERFEAETSGYKRNAVCVKGCSFCCTFMGSVDITTLEGVIILERLSAFDQGQRSSILSAIEADRKEKEKGRNSPCPFLDEQGACSIYDVRPFSCRQLYSLKKCETAGATIHRRAYEMSRKAISGIQRLDDTGYSGHLSFILHLLEDDEFREVYLAGRFDPDGIRDFGRSHGFFINRRAQNTP